MNNLNKPKNAIILSFNGGGIRGLIEALWINDLEFRLKEEFGKDFLLKDLHRKNPNTILTLTGTSTGSMIACAIAKGIPTEEIVDIYLSMGGDIFRGPWSKWFFKLITMFKYGISSPMHSAKNLEKKLKEVLGEDIRFKDIDIPITIPICDAVSNKPIILKNWHKECNGIKLWEVCRASSAAPGYFPSFLMVYNNQEMAAWDGGMANNNPSFSALTAISKDLYKISPRNIIIGSYGTGIEETSYDAKDTKDFGFLEFAINGGISKILKYNEGVSEYYCQNWLPKNKYISFNTKISNDIVQMDKADEKTLMRLSDTAYYYMKTPEYIKKVNMLINNILDLTR